MILRSKTLLLPSIVLLIGTVFGASATNASATNASATNASATNAFADDPFKNIGDIDDDSFPVGFVDKIKVFRYAQIE
jgi:hypothetical protein